MKTATKKETKERPILFSTPMIKAILEGRKTQTRRLINWKKENLGGIKDSFIEVKESSLGLPYFRMFNGHGHNTIKCPYGKVGDTLCPVHTGYGKIDDRQTSNHKEKNNGNQDKGRSFTETDTDSTEQRLYGGRGRADLFAETIQGIHPQQNCGLVSAKRESELKGVYDYQYVSSEQESYPNNSQVDLYGVSRDAAEEVNASEAFGRNSDKHQTRKSNLGDSRGKLGGQTGTRNSVCGRETLGVEIDGQGAGTHSLGNIEGALQHQTRGESFRNVATSNSAHCICSNRLWVKETFYAFGKFDYTGKTTKSGKREVEFLDFTLKANLNYLYPANREIPTTKDRFELGWHKRPSIFMPREASRITLEITNIKVERIRDISESDAIAEGVAVPKMYPSAFAPYRNAFKELWESINGKESWGQNVWVWCISFRRVENGIS